MQICQTISVQTPEKVFREYFWGKGETSHMGEYNECNLENHLSIAGRMKLNSVKEWYTCRYACWTTSGLSIYFKFPPSRCCFLEFHEMNLQ